MIKCVLQTCLDVRQCQFGHNCLYRSFDTVFQASRLKTSKKKKLPMKVRQKVVKHIIYRSKNVSDLKN